VVAVHGVVDNPLDHRTPYPPLYTVVFDLESRQADQVCVDLHEDWLEDATEACPATTESGVAGDAPGETGEP
jgi:hypothetical protein